MELREILESKVKIISEKKTRYDSMTILAPWIVTGRKNRNGRLYGYDLIKKEVARLQPSVKAGAAIGSADHPAGALTTLADASHIITKLEIGDDNKGWMTAKILNTTKGKNVIEIIKAGGQLGISARGAGTISPSGTVESDYRLLGIDFCTSPSEPTAVFDKSNICESLEFEEQEDNLDNSDVQRQKDLEEEICKLEIESFLSAKESGFVGSQEDWDRKYGGNLREMMGLKEDDGKTVTEEELTEEQVKDRTFSYYEEGVRGGFRGSFDEWKKAYPKLVEKASEAMKLSEQKAPKSKEPFVGDVRFYYMEAVKSGYKDTLEKFKEEHPEFVAEGYEEKIAEEAKTQKPISETIDEEATRIFTELKKQNPNSALKLEHVRNMLEKEEEAKADKRIRRKAIAIVSRDLQGNMSQETIEKMVAKEIEALKEERAEKKRKNWEAYKRLLDE